MQAVVSISSLNPLNLTRVDQVAAERSEIGMASRDDAIHLFFRIQPARLKVFDEPAQDRESLLVVHRDAYQAACDIDKCLQHATVIALLLVVQVRSPPVRWLDIDPRQIKQALVNLVKNAIQAMTKGGRLILRSSHASEGIVVSVADTGGGIPEEKINRIFEPFYTTKKKGSGLGLMIVQRIVREHGGRIELESRVNKGTTFRIWLPLRERRPRLLAAGVEPANKEPGA